MSYAAFAWRPTHRNDQANPNSSPVRFALRGFFMRNLTIPRYMCLLFRETVDTCSFSLRISRSHPEQRWTSMAKSGLVLRPTSLSKADMPARDSRDDRFEPLWCKPFLEHLKETANVAASARAAGVTGQAVYTYRKKHPWFALEWNDALKIGVSHIEETLRKRAVGEFYEDVYHKGEVVGQKRIFSDTAAIFLLKGLKPDVYRDRSTVEHTGSVKHKHLHKPDLSQITIDDLREIRSMIDRGQLVLAEPVDEDAAED